MIQIGYVCGKLVGIVHISFFFRQNKQLQSLLIFIEKEKERDCWGASSRDINPSSLKKNIFFSGNIDEQTKEWMRENQQNESVYRWQSKHHYAFKKENLKWFEQFLIFRYFVDCYNRFFFPLIAAWEKSTN